MYAGNATQLGQVAAKRPSEFQVSLDMKNLVVTLKGVGPVAWALFIAAIGGAIWAASATPAATVATAPAGGVGGAVTFGSAAAASAAAATIVGAKTAALLVAVGVAAGGVGVISALYSDYDVVQRGQQYYLVRNY